MEGILNIRTIIALVITVALFTAHSEAFCREFSQPTDPSINGERMSMETINARLARHDASVLSIVPIQGFQDGLAGLFREYHLRVNNDSWIGYLDEKNRGKGYHLRIFFSRIRPSGIYGELAGFQADWFKADAAPTFVPINGWAKRLSERNEAWLRFGGPLETNDRP